MDPNGVYTFIQRTGKLDTNLRHRIMSTRKNGAIVRDKQIKKTPIPEDFAEAKIRCYILKQTIALIIYAHPNIPHIQITQTDIFDHYEWF